ncbi:MAG: cytochrome c oxidase assembly protein, partial [Sciscionella sp.]|nr:cytochrome c oxidase assembly protein [Sciscionella sp.]
ALTFPPLVTVVLIAPPFLLYLTPIYPWSLRHAVGAGLIDIVLVLAGFGYYWTRLRVDPTPHDDAHLVSVWIAIAEVIFDGALGLVLWLGPLRAGDYYTALHRDWGPSPRIDQVIGAGILWLGGDAIGLPYLGALFVRWLRDDERRAAAIDRELDQQSAELAADDGSITSSTDGVTEERQTNSGLWWENDPQLTERFRRR